MVPLSRIEQLTLTLAARHFVQAAFALMLERICQDLSDAIFAAEEC